MIKLSSILLKFISLVLGLEELNSFPAPLSKEEEVVLFQNKDKGDMAARDKIIEHNLRLVSHIIKKYYSTYEYTDELLSIGSLGLIKAVDSFKSNFGTKFATYGARCIQNEILMFFRSKKRNLCDVSINDTIDVDKDGNPLTYLDIISVDEPIENKLDFKEYIEKVRDFVDTALDKRENQIIVLRYGLKGFMPKTQREVASYLNISRSYVSRIEKRALEKLRAEFGENIPCFDE